ncbi:MAG: hypothetical protein ACFFDR_09980, partial [Candidatus Thorarchaeota archaeon]
MQITDYYELIRQRIGFLILFMLVMPSGFIFLTLQSGAEVIGFVSIIGVAGGIISFEGITFDLQFLTLGPNTTMTLWIYGLIYGGLNLGIIVYLWLYSGGKKERSDVVTGIIWLSILMLIIGGLSVFPIPFVAIGVILRMILYNGEVIQDEIPSSMEPLQIQTEAQESVYTQPPAEALNEPLPEKRTTTTYRVKRFFIHGLAFSVLDLIFGLMWPILAGIALASGVYLGSVPLVLALGLVLGSIFVGTGLINAWLSERIWKIQWKYGVFHLLFCGIALFAVLQILVSPFSTLVAIFIDTSILIV